MTAVVDGITNLVASAGVSILVKATLTLLVTLLAVRLARQRPASVRHLLVSAGLVVVAVLPIAAAISPVTVEVAPVAFILDEYVGEPPQEGLAAAPLATLEPAPISAVPRMYPTASDLAVLWGAGVLLFAVPIVVGLLQVGRLRRTALPWLDGERLVGSVAREAGLGRRVDVLIHEGVAAPATCGFLRHAVIFPIDVATWPEADVLRAAVHEVEHVRRRDCVVNAIARLVCAVYWFHPLVWIAWRRLALEAERACDDAVLRRAEATGYADQLVTLAGRLPAQARHPLLAMANRSDLVERIAAVLDDRQPRGRVGTGVVACTAVAACALVAALSPLQAVSVRSPVPNGGVQNAEAGPVPTFEVATVRINRSGGTRARHSIVPASGRLTITNITVRQLIQEAYGVPLTAQLVNVPDWASEQRVDVVAKAASPAPARVLQRMLQPLLAEYFKLAIRREQRDMDVFAMVVDEPGRLGPRLRRNDDECDDAVGTAGGFARAPEGAPNQKGTCGILPGGAGRIVGRGLSMPDLAAFIGTSPGRRVIDRTGLTERFDVDLTYTPSAFAAAALAQRPGATPPPGVDPSGPPLITALREQLGLRLEPVRAPVEVLVIEQAEPLTAEGPAAGGAAPAQRDSPPAFEVASIRRNMVGFAADVSRVEGARYTASNMTLDQLVRDAYRMPLVGGPDWIRDAPGRPRPGETRFDVVATIPPGTPPDQVPLMLRTLLAERFNLVVHTETQERPAYALVHARDDKRLGPRLNRSTQQCQVEIAAGPLRAPVRRVTEDGKPMCSMMTGPASIRGGGLTLPFLASALGVFAGRMVVDRTGLEGPFDFELTYAPAAARGGGPPPASDDRPSIFTAVQEQLGLKLEPSNEPVEVLVVDSVSLPTEN